MPIGVDRGITEVRGLGDIDSAVAVQTVTINEAGAGTPTIYTPPSGRVFLVFQLFLQQPASVDVRSGATNIGKVTSPADIKNNALPIFVGRVAGEAFVLNTSAALNGFAVVGYRDTGL